MSVLRNPYKGDYDHAPEVDKKGRFRDRFFYIGDLYILPFDENEKKKTYIPCVIYGILMMGAVLVQGMIDQSSSRTLWVVLPYFIQFLPILFFLVGIVEYVLATPRMTRAQYDKGVGRMRFCSAALIVLTAISAICDIIYMVIRRGEYVIWKELLYFFVHFLTVIIAIMYGQYYNRKFSNITIKSNK